MCEEEEEEEEMIHYLEQLGDKYIIVGDINAHTPILDTNAKTDVTGSTLEKFLTDTDTCLINPLNLYTYLDKRTGRQSCLDVCLSSASIAPLIDIDRFIDMGSDHMSLKATVQITIERTARHHKARWRKIGEGLRLFRDHFIVSNIQKPNDIDAITADLTERIVNSARAIIG